MAPEPIPEITPDNEEEKISREELRRVLAALGYDLPISMQDVTEQATNFVKLQDQISTAMDELIRDHAAKDKDSFEPYAQDRLKALSDMQEKLHKAGGLLQTYAYTEFTEAKKLPTDLGVGQIQQLFKDGLITEDQVLGKLGALNYRPEDAALLLESYKNGNAKVEEGQDLSVSQVQALMRAGIMNRATAKEKLIRLKYDPSDADALLKLVDQDIKDAATAEAAKAAKSGGTAPGDPYGVQAAASGGASASKAPGAKPTAVPQQAPAVNQLNKAFTGFQDQMRPSLPKTERLPTAQEFLSDFDNAWATRLSSMNLSPDMQAFANSFVKSKYMAEYTGQLGRMASQGVSPYKLTKVTPQERGLGYVANDPGAQGVGGKVSRDGAMQTAAQAAGFTNEYVAEPIIKPLEFLNGLDSATIQLMYEGSRSGAGQGNDRGNSQAQLREGV